MCIPPLFYLGNGWADFFARAGALEHRISQVYEDLYLMEYRQHQCVAKYMAWAMRRMLDLGGWEPEQAYVPVRAPVRREPQLTVVEHQLVRLGTGPLLCRACCRSTSVVAGPTLGQFLRSECKPNVIEQLRAEAHIRKFGAHVLPRSVAVRAALEAADRMEEQAGEALPSFDEVASLWNEQDLVEHDGHKLRRAGATVFCERCVSWSGSGFSAALHRPCEGFPSGEGKASTYISNLRGRLRQLMSSRHPKTREAL